MSHSREESQEEPKREHSNDNTETRKGILKRKDHRHWTSAKNIFHSQNTEEEGEEEGELLELI